MKWLSKTVKKKAEEMLKKELARAQHLLKVEFLTIIDQNYTLRD